MYAAIARIKSHGQSTSYYYVKIHPVDSRTTESYVDNATDDIGGTTCHIYAENSLLNIKEAEKNFKSEMDAGNEYTWTAFD